MESALWSQPTSAAGGARLLGRSGFAHASIRIECSQRRPEALIPLVHGATPFQLEGPAASNESGPKIMPTAQKGLQKLFSAYGSNA